MEAVGGEDEGSLRGAKTPKTELFPSSRKTICLNKALDVFQTLENALVLSFYPKKYVR